MSGTQRSFVLVLLLLVHGLWGCTSISSGAHHDDQYSGFDQLRSFAWIADDPLILGEGQVSPISPLTKKKITRAIENSLLQRGYGRVDYEEADFLVSYTVGTRDKITVKSYPIVFRGEWAWHIYGTSGVVNQQSHDVHTEGTLGIDFFDAETGEPVWHGWATKTITERDRSEPGPSIAEGVEAILSHFPPAG